MNSRPIRSASCKAEDVICTWVPIWLADVWQLADNWMGTVNGNRIGSSRRVWIGMDRIEWFNGWASTFLSPPLIYMFTLDIGQLKNMQCRWRWELSKSRVGGLIGVCMRCHLQGSFQPRVQAAASSHTAPSMYSSDRPQTADCGAELQTASLSSSLLCKAESCWGVGTSPPLFFACRILRRVMYDERTITDIAASFLAIFALHSRCHSCPSVYIDRDASSVA